MIKDKHNTTAFFVFTTGVKGLNLLRVHGPAGSLSADIIAGTIVRTRSRPCKSYLTYVIPPLRQAREYLRNTAANVMNFLRRRLYQDFGMKELIERFYTASAWEPAAHSLSRNHSNRPDHGRNLRPDLSCGGPSCRAGRSGRMGPVFLITCHHPSLWRMKYVLITPAHNEETFIEKTLDSMVAQTALPERWVIVDDGSDDRTAEIVARYAERHPWIELIRRPRLSEPQFRRKSPCL